MLWSNVSQHSFIMPIVKELIDYDEPLFQVKKRRKRALIALRSALMTKDSVFDFVDFELSDFFSWREKLPKIELSGVDVEQQDVQDGIEHLVNWGLITVTGNNHYTVKRCDIPRIGKSFFIQFPSVGIEVIPAITARERAIGLSDTKRLDEFEGMVFTEPFMHRVDFHTGGITFPIDILFCSRAQKHFDVQKIDQLEPHTEKIVSGLADLVLEVNAGFCVHYGITLDTQFEVTGQLH